MKSKQIKPQAVEPLTLGLKETAVRLGISQSFLYTHTDHLPHFKIGNRIRFDVAEVMRALRAK